MKLLEILQCCLRRHKGQAAEEVSGKAGEEPKQEDHSLQAQARERARHPDHLNVGTPFDWEELEAYQKELDRLDREGPGGHKASSNPSGKKGNH